MLSAFLYTQAAQMSELPDSLRLLHDVEVNYNAPAQGVKVSSQGVNVTSAGIRSGIHVLGEADAIRTLSMLPGFNTGSDYSSGLSINGSDFAHNAYTIDGARVFFPYHFGGIFSVFNTDFISSLHVDNSPSILSPYSIGASMDVKSPSYVAEDLSGALGVGILSSDLSLAVPFAQIASVRASARMSYLDLLYGNMLSDGDNVTKYAFQDFNFSSVIQIGRKTRLKLSAFNDNDRLRFDDEDYTLDTRLKWRNAAASATLIHEGEKYASENTFSFSGLWSRLSMGMSQFSVSMPSDVRQLTLAGVLHHQSSGFSFSYRGEHDEFHPIYAKGVGAIDASSASRRLNSSLVSLGASKHLSFGSIFDLAASLRGSCYNTSGYTRISFDPVVTLSRRSGAFDWSISASAATQNMHYVGFSDLGMASNFYLPANADLPLEKSYGMNAFMQYRLSNRVSASFEPFFKWLTDVAEYHGDVLNVLLADYDPNEYVSLGKGFNAGANMLVNFDYGVLSGWGGYSLTVSRRNFSDDPDSWVNAANQPLHSFKALVAWHPAPKIDVSAFFTLQSGRAYTPVEAIFIVGGNVLTEYGKRNSARLPLYHRLDLSFTYHLSRWHIGAHGIDSQINFSLINAYGRNNVEMQYFSYNEVKNTISLHQVQSLYRFLPSLSYSLRF